MNNYPPNLRIKEQPFKVGEIVRPHFNFKHYYPFVPTCTVVSCEKGFCQTGWLVKVKEFNNTAFGKQEYDSSWFFKIR